MKKNKQSIQYNKLIKNDMIEVKNIKLIDSEIDYDKFNKINNYNKIYDYDIINIIKTYIQGYANNCNTELYNNRVQLITLDYEGNQVLINSDKRCYKDIIKQLEILKEYNIITYNYLNK